VREGHTKSAPSRSKDSNWIVTLVFVAGTSCKIRPFEMLGEGGMAGLGLGAFHQICLAWYALVDFCNQIRCLSLLAFLEVLNVLWSSKRSLTMKRTVLQTAYVCLSHMFTQHFWQAKTKFLGWLFSGFPSRRREPEAQESRATFVCRVLTTERHLERQFENSWSLCAWMTCTCYTFSRSFNSLIHHFPNKQDSQ